MQVGKLNPVFWEKYGELLYVQLLYVDIARANSVDPDQMPQSAASDQGLHCLPLVQQFLDTSASSKTDFIKF